MKSASRADVRVVAGTAAAVLMAVAASAQSRPAPASPAWFVCAGGTSSHAVHAVRRLMALSDKATVEADVARVFAQREKEQREKQLAEQKKAEQDKQKKLAEDKRKADEAAKRKAEAEAKQLAEMREANLRRIQGMAGATGGETATGTAQRSAGPSGSYGGKVAAKVKPNIVYPDAISGNPRAEVEVKLAPDGTIVGRRLVQSSDLEQRSGANQWRSRADSNRCRSDGRQCADDAADDGAGGWHAEVFHDGEFGVAGRHHRGG